MRLNSLPRLAAVTATASALFLTACGDKPSTSTKTPPANGASAPAGDGHAGQDGAHAGPVIALGETDVGKFHVKATRDQGNIVAGKDAPIDVTVTPAAGSDSKVKGVRFWIGTEDGKGSVKARAEIEDPTDPNRWHTHAEIPNPIPTGSMLWIEIETDTGDVAKISFGLKE
jgi:hypothetical protein